MSVETKTDWERLVAYRECAKRGHLSSGVTLTSNPPWAVCAECGTHYREETRIVEQNAPRSALCPREHFKGVKCPENDCAW
jgi:hypothetical protein